MSSIRLDFVSQDHMVFSGDVYEIVAPGIEGQLGILPKHAPLVAQLAIGRLRALTGGGEWLNFAVAEGFVKVQFNKVIVLADAAEEASSIDVPRAEKAVERALSRLEMHRTGTVPEDDRVDPYREQVAVKRARNRIKVAQMA